MDNPARSAAEMVQRNELQRRAVLGNAIRMTQQVQSVTVNPAEQSKVTFRPKNVGLLMGFIIEVTADVTNGAVDAATRTELGSSNILSNIRFDDLGNYTRVDVPGWYLALLNSAKRGYTYGGAYGNSIPMGYGANWNIFSAPASLAAAEAGTIKHTYHLPISYGPTDLRGAIYMGTTGATADLTVDLNTAPFVGAGNSVGAVYSGNATGAYNGSVTITVYQIYLDQIPRDANGAPILPMMDLNTVYDLKKTTHTGMTVGQDFPMAYSNFRSFLSTTVLFDNGGSFNAGSDVTDFSLTSANATNIWRVSPEIAALGARTAFLGDPPKGVYYFDTRDMPINTRNYGNMELNVKAAIVNVNARALVGYESFASLGNIASATSLSAG